MTLNSISEQLRMLLTRGNSFHSFHHGNCITHRQIRWAACMQNHRWRNENIQKSEEIFFLSRPLLTSCEAWFNPNPFLSAKDWRPSLRRSRLELQTIKRGGIFFFFSSFNTIKERVTVWGIIAHTVLTSSRKKGLLYLYFILQKLNWSMGKLQLEPCILIHPNCVVASV